jgi:hypothetical protein
MTDLEKLREHKIGITGISQTNGDQYNIELSASGSRTESDTTIYHYLKFYVIVDHLSEVVDKAIKLKAQILK